MINIIIILKFFQKITKDILKNIEMLRFKLVKNT